jgi:hypothetical protein
MADRRFRDLRRLLDTLADPYGAAVIIEKTGGSHWRCTFTLGARHAFIIASFSPSDRNASRHVTADARRTLRHLANTEVMA